MQTQFLNADLELFSRYKLSKITTALERIGLHAIQEPLQRGNRWFAAFEHCGRHGDTAELCARSMLRCLDRLDEPERAALLACARRVLNLGYEVGTTGAFTDELQVTTTRRLAELRIGIGVTMYVTSRESVERS